MNVPRQKILELEVFSKTYVCYKDASSSVLTAISIAILLQLVLLGLAIGATGKFLSDNYHVSFWVFAAIVLASGIQLERNGKKIWPFDGSLNQWLMAILIFASIIIFTKQENYVLASPLVIYFFLTLVNNSNYNLVLVKKVYGPSD